MLNVCLFLPSPLPCTLNINPFLGWGRVLSDQH